MSEISRQPQQIPRRQTTRKNAAGRPTSKSFFGFSNRFVSSTTVAVWTILTCNIFDVVPRANYPSFTQLYARKTVRLFDGNLLQFTTTINTYERKKRIVNATYTVEMKGLYNNVTLTDVKCLLYYNILYYTQLRRSSNFMINVLKWKNPWKKCYNFFSFIFCC